MTERILTCIFTLGYKTGSSFQRRCVDRIAVNRNSMLRTFPERNYLQSHKDVKNNVCCFSSDRRTANV